MSTCRRSRARHPSSLLFATKFLEHFDEQGIVCRVAWVETNRFPPNVPREILGDEGAELFTAEMLSRAATTPRDFDRLAAEDFVTFLEPPSRDDRIVSQYAIFSLMSSVAARLDSWLERHPAVYQRIIIPAELKWEARDKLDPANMTERVLYPGQAALSRWLKRHDTPRWSR